MEVIFEAILQALFETIIQPVLVFAGYVLMILLTYLIGLPLLCLFCTPMVLVVACFGPGSYGNKVVSGYKGVLAGAGGCDGSLGW